MGKKKEKPKSNADYLLEIADYQAKLDENLVAMRSYLDKREEMLTESKDNLLGVVSIMSEASQMELEVFIKQSEERRVVLTKEIMQAEKELTDLHKTKKQLEEDLKTAEGKKKTEIEEKLKGLEAQEKILEAKQESYLERHKIIIEEVQLLELQALANRLANLRAAGMSEMEIEKIKNEELARIAEKHFVSKAKKLDDYEAVEKKITEESVKKEKEALAEKLKEMETHAGEAKKILTSIFKTADDFIKQKIDVRKKQIESISEKIKQVDEEIKLTAKQTQDQLDRDKAKYLKEYNYEPKEGEEVETEESVKAELAELEKLYKLKQEIEAFEKKKNTDKAEQKVTEKEQQEVDQSEKEQIEEEAEAAAAKDEGAKERSVELTAEQAERLSTLSNKHGEVAEALQSQTDAEKAANTEKEQLEKEKKKLEEKNARDERKQQKLKMAQSMLEGGMNVALSITKALAMGPGIGKVLAIIASAAGAVQLAFMASQMAKMKNLKAEDGGLLFGKRHASGGMRIEGTNIEVEGGEYIVNRESTKKNLGLMRYINSQRKELQANDINAYFGGQARGYETAFRQQFMAGGELPPLQNNASIDSDGMIEAIRSIKFEPKVAVTDIIRAQEEMTSVAGWAGI